MAQPVVILGLGFSTQRLARRLRQRGIAVYAAVRGANRFTEFQALGVRLADLSSDDWPKDAVLVHSVPPLAEPEKSRLRNLSRRIEPRRILYISSTSVYGAETHVSEDTPVAPNDGKGLARVDEEEWIASPGAPWSSLILRSSAIYGPGRGVHVRLREGRWQNPRGNGGLVSRIHVDDLVTMLEAGIESQIGGAWPVADENPATSEEVAAWCANQLGMAVPEIEGDGIRVAGRSVDGRKIGELLGVKLKYVSYQAGITACLREEGLGIPRRN